MARPSLYTTKQRQVAVYVRDSQKDILLAEAEKAGMSMNALIINVLTERFPALARENHLRQDS